MNLIKGKQLNNSTIEQRNVYIENDSITSGTSVTNKQYLYNLINEKLGGIHHSKLNQHMTANNATIGQKACELAVIEFPISNILIKVNGTIVNVGESLDCYFSPDGTIIRTGGNAQKGDYLYWNSSKYNLTIDDEIDFEYLVGYDYETLNSGTTVSLKPIYESIVVKYIGESGTTMDVIIDGNTITVGNINDQFVWDIGGDDEHIFTNINEYINVTINTKEYTIWFDGFGSLIFSVKKGKITTTRYLISLIEEDLINGNVEYLQFKNDDITFITNNSMVTYSDKLYLHSNNTNTELNLPETYNNQRNISDMIVSNNNIFISTTLKESEFSESRSYILSSNDNGDTWVERYEGANQNHLITNLYSVEDNGIMFATMRTPSTGYTSFNYALLKSVDSGNTWNIINNNIVTCNYVRLTVLDDLNIWATYNESVLTGGTYQLIHYIYKSTDGGLSFNKILENNKPNYSDMTFINSNTGFLISRDENKLMKSEDGGETWSEIVLDISITEYYQLHKLRFNNKLYVGLYTSEPTFLSYLLISDDYGLTWEEKLITNIESSINDIEIKDDLNFVASLSIRNAYFMPTLFKTTDGGNTWTQILNENNKYKFTDFNSCIFINDNVGWAVGENKSLIKTTDGGQTWYFYDLDLEDANYYFTNIHFFNSNNGFIIGTKDGSYPIILKTNNGGNSWTQQTSPINECYFNDACFINENQVFIIGSYYDYNTSTNSSILLKTTDGGDNWVDGELTFENLNLSSIAFKDSLNGIIVGETMLNDEYYSIMYKTTDGGLTWNSYANMNLLNFSFSYITYYNNKYYLAATDNNDNTISYLYESSDSNTWSVVNVNYDDITGNIGVISFNGTVGLFIYYYQNSECCVYQSNDSGLNWNKVENTTITGGYNTISGKFIFGIKNTHVTKILKLN